MKGGGGKVEATQHNAGADPGLDDGKSKKNERKRAVPF